ncbi:hypothetical protein RSOL_470150, partial [Rhizoctonia solani AG-3 Rhs1AP]
MLVELPHLYSTMPKCAATTASKHLLSNPGDISISLAPAVPKKPKAKGPALDDTTGLLVKATQSTIKKANPPIETTKPESDPVPAPLPPPKKKTPKPKQPKSEVTPSATGKKKAKPVHQENCQLLLRVR